MPAFPQDDQNFIHGLADFWTAFFRDSDRIRAAYRGQQIQFGQLYLDLLDATLGVSLDHAPLFSRRYFQDYYVREDLLTFVEGPSPADDRWIFVPDAVVAAVPCLMNRVIAPTCVVESPREYEVREGAVFFRENPLDAERYAPFPVRQVDVEFPAALRGEWGDAKPGDVFQFAVAGGTTVRVRVRGVHGNDLLLDDAPPELVAARDAPVPVATVRVVREPFDYAQSGNDVVRPTAVVELAATPVAGTKTLNVAGADPAWANKFLAFVDPTAPRNGGFHRVNAAGAGVVTVDAPADFLPSAALTAYLVTFPDGVGDPASSELPHANIRPGTLVVNARRLQAMGAGYPAGGGVVEGVDFEVDYGLGRVFYKSAWDPAQAAKASYEWDLVVAEETYTSEVVPFAFGLVRPMREMSAWAADVLVDRDVLYRNFGYLLGFRRPSSEAYRAFLQGVARLYLLGTSATRLETALNVMFGLPVVREDGEVLKGYDDGVAASSDATAAGRLTDTNEGRDGELDAGSSTFASPTAGFLPDDIGATIVLRSAAGTREVVVTSVVSATVAVVSPTPGADEAGVVWSYTHVSITRRFTVSHASFAFTDEDLGADVVISGARNSRNNGAFRVIAVENPSSVRLESSWGFIDETGLSWKLTRTREQRVVTNRRTYRLPFGVPPSDAVADPDSIGSYRFVGYEALTNAFLVVSEDIDPTWWHKITIPEELLDDAGDDARRRYVSSQLVEHIAGAIDAPYCGDPDLYAGLDDEGRPGVRREGTGLWAGGPWLILNTDPPVAARDVGRYVVVSTPAFEGQYKILELRDDGATVKLERFPPPEAEGVPAPATVDVRLPDLLFRRTVAFVLMDRFLRRHAIAIRVDPSVAGNVELLNEAAALVREAKPAHLYAFIETSSDLVDAVSLGETLAVGLTATLNDAIAVIDNRIHATPDSLLEAGDAYTYVDQDFAVAYPGGAYTLMLTPGAPYAGPYRWRFIFGRFVVGTVTIDGHTRRLAEGSDYTFNRTTGELSIQRGNVGSLTFRARACFLRDRSGGATLLDFETRIAASGENPAGGASEHPVALVDRPVSIRIT